MFPKISRSWGYVSICRRHLAATFETLLWFSFCLVLSTLFSYFRFWVGFCLGWLSMGWISRPSPGLPGVEEFRISVFTVFVGSSILREVRSVPAPFPPYSHGHSFFPSRPHFSTPPRLAPF